MVIRRLRVLLCPDQFRQRRILRGVCGEHKNHPLPLKIRRSFADGILKPGQWMTLPGERDSLIARNGQQNSIVRSNR
jgi:hypothetical protein